MCLGLTFSSGANQPADWLPFLLGIGALALVSCVSGPAIVASKRFPLILLGIFGLQAIWTTLSLLWASSLSNAWEEVDRTLFYAVALVLVFAALRWAGITGLRALAALLATAIGVAGVVLVVRLAISDDPSRYFSSARLQYPITYFNGLAAFFMMGFWLALGMANGAGGTRGARHAGWLRGSQAVLLALAAFLLELALLPQSRGAFWTFFFVVPFFVVLSTNRFRALAHLAIVVLPVALFWPRLNGVYAALHAKQAIQPALGRALAAIGYSVVIVLVAWALSWLVERVIGPLSRRVRFWIAIGLIVLAVGGAVGGLVYADHRTGGLDHYLGDRWAELTNDGGAGAQATSRFGAFGLNGRVRQYRVAAQAFEENPLLGVGAQNYEVYYYLHRRDVVEVKQPHSQLMQLLAELGLPGLLLWLAFFFVTVVRAAVIRFRSPSRMTQALLAAMITAALSWFVHSSADWLWQLAAVSLPAMMLMGGLVAADLALPARPTSADVPSPAADAGRPGSGDSDQAVRPRRRLRLVRPLLAVLTLAVLVSAALPYLSIRYSRFASVAADLPTVVSRTRIAADLDPTTVLPFATLANAHKMAAQRAPADSPERALQLKLAAEAWVDATKRDPAVWLNYYQAADLYVQARDAARVTGATLSEEMDQLARTYLEQASRLNPLSPQVQGLLKKL